MREQHLHHLRDAARAMKFGGYVASRRLEIAQHRGALANGLEVVDGERDVGGVCDREQMQHGVGRSADRHHHRDRVLESLARVMIWRGSTLAMHRRRPGTSRPSARRSRLSRHPQTPWSRNTPEAHPHCLDGRRHRVGRIHPAARAGAGAGVALDFEQLGLADLVRTDTSPTASKALTIVRSRAIAACPGLIVPP